MTSRVEELVPLGKLDLFIKLSRLWVLDSCEHVEICKITKKPPHTRIPFEVLVFTVILITLEVLNVTSFLTDFTTTEVHRHGTSFCCMHSAFS